MDLPPVTTAIHNFQINHPTLSSSVKALTILIGAVAVVAGIFGIELTQGQGMPILS